MMRAAASSSSSSALPPSKKYDVFISFRGEDTRTTFTSHLYTALWNRDIKTFIDNYELRKGDEISEALIRAIEDSSISLVIFSRDYASSKWCLNELGKILQCKEHQGQVVIPVFYEVDPSHVRHQKGTYREAFAKHEEDFRHNQEKVNKWKRALYEIANLAGWTWNSSTYYRDESELIQNIINDVLQKLDHRHPSTSKDLVGVDENCRSIELLLEKDPVIGIWGMGGIGKTTMAKVVFAKLSPYYESCCFLENVREESEKHGLKYLRDKLVSDLLKEENIHNYRPKVVGSPFVRRRLSCRKVFIVFDDVDSSKQLEYLAEECDCLGLGSRVIITTRDKQLLIGRVNEIYEAKPLNHEESFKLFSFKAFHNDHPEFGYEQLSKRVVVYTKGIPLALIVLGSFLKSKTKEEWDSALKKLERTPNKDIQKVLKLSYDGLDFEEKEIFLDIACLLKGEYKEHVIAVLNSCGFHATIGLRTLVDKALITMGKKVWMHDLIQQMGWEIVRQECLKEPGRRSRLWDPKEVYDVLKNNLGTEFVEGIILNVSRIRHIHLTADTLKNMTNIRFLKFYSSLNTRSCNVHLQTGLEFISQKIRYFQWDGYPLRSLPSTFCAENLVELKMPYSHVQTLWEGVQDFVNLKRIDLCFSLKLRELPDFSKAHNLKWVKLYHCESLYYVHPSILSLNSLVYLDLAMCISLKSLQSETHLRSLETLLIHGCTSLKELSLSSEELTHLSLRTTGIEILHSSIGRLIKLKSLNFNGSRLKNLPIKELCCLTSLEELFIYGGIIDNSKLHMLFNAIRAIRILCFHDCRNLTELPTNINRLSRLQKLYIRRCKNLQCLPRLPISVRELYVNDCISLSSNFTIGNLEYLERLDLSKVSCFGSLSMTHLSCFSYLVVLSLRKCTHIVDRLVLQILFDAMQHLQMLELEECSYLTELPHNVKHLSRLQHLSLKGCIRLRFLPELPRFIINFTADNCISLETAFISTISMLLRANGCFNYFSFHNCVKLDGHFLCAIQKYAEFSLKRAVYHEQKFTILYPGFSVPMWFGHNQTTEASVSIKLSNNLMGFVFCSVIPLFNSKEKAFYQNRKNNRKEKVEDVVICKCYFGEGEPIGLHISLFPNLFYHYYPQSAKFESDHVLLYCDPSFFRLFLDRLKGSRMNEEGPTCNREILFRFMFPNRFIKKCGVCPLYASNIHG